MPSTDHKILLKLEMPISGQTYVGNSAKIKFWIADPSKNSAISPSDFTFQILCQEVKDSISSSYIGTMEEVVVFSSQNANSSMASLSVDGVTFKEGNVYNSPDGKVSSSILEVEGELKRDVNFFGTCLIKIRACVNGVYVTSNFSSITFGSRELFAGKFLGGPIRSLPEFHYGKAIILRGWAVSLGSEIDSVEAIVPTATSIFVSSRLQFKELENSLPDLEEIKNSGIEIVCLFDKYLDREQITFNVRVKFKSGESYDYYWGSSVVSNEVDEGFVVTKLREEGRWVKFEGKIFSPLLNKIQFFLTSTRVVKELHSDYFQIEPADQNPQEVDVSYYCSKGAPKISFLLPNDFLGGNPGSVFLESRVGGQKISVVGKFLRERLSLLFNNDRVEGRNFLSKTFSYLGKKGLLPLKSVDFYPVEEKQINKSHILFVTHNLSLTEGAPKVLYSIVKQVSKKYSSSLISLREGEGRDVLSSYVKQIKVLPELDNTGLDYSRFCSGVDRANEIFRDERPSLVVANGIDSFPLVCTALDLGIQTIWIIHESIDPAHWYTQLPTSIRHRFLFALRFATKVVFVTQKTRELYLSFLEKDSSLVINNGIDFNEFSSSCKSVDREMERIRLGVKPGEIFLLNVGTTTERKGQDRTVRELAVLKRNHPEVKFKMCFVGGREAPFLWSLRQLIDRLGLQDDVILIPETNDVAKYYAIADLFIVNSREESSPLVVLEAFASGIPVLSTTVFGLSELIIDGKTALAFDGEREGQLSSLIEKISKSPVLKTELVAGSFKFVEEQHSSQNMLSKYENLISKMLG